MTQPHISAIINAHREGLLAGPTLRSLDKAAENAQRNGVQVEILAVLDRSDAFTREVFEFWLQKAQKQYKVLLNVELGDLGLARNAGVARARGKWIAFLDADDLWASNWLTAAYRFAEAEARQTVWHPEVNLYFGARPHIFTHIDMDEPSFSSAILAQTNLWTALCFAERSLLVDVPYRPTIHDRQIGYEDWGWNLETIARGAVHKIVPETVHAVRTKAVSLVSQTTAAACLPHATDLFRNILDEKAGAFVKRRQVPMMVAV